MVIIGLLLFSFLILVHELGHFWVARRNKIEVEEFGAGFPPRIFSRRFGKSKTLYSLNLIPLGGFVRLKGESTNDKRRGSFGAARFKTQALVLTAGVGMNIIATFGLLLVLAFTGLPQIVEGQFSIRQNEQRLQDKITAIAIENGSPASRAGLNAGDEILSVDGKRLGDAQALIDTTRESKAKTVSLTWRQPSGQAINKAIGLEGKPGEGSRLGIEPYDERVFRYTWAAPLVAVGLTVQLLWLTLVGVGQIIIGLLTQGGDSAAVSGTVGPIGLYALLSSAGEFGFIYVLVLMAVVSVSLAIINILPIPALDGGRLALIAAFKALKRPLPSRVESLVHGIGFIALLLLAVLIGYLDILRFF